MTVVGTTACGTGLVPSSPPDSFDVRACGVTSAAEIEWSGESSVQDLGLPVEDLPPRVPRDEPVAVYVSVPDQQGGRIYCIVIDGEVAHTGVSPSGWTPPED